MSTETLTPTANNDEHIRHSEVHTINQMNHIHEMIGRKAVRLGLGHLEQQGDRSSSTASLETAQDDDGFSTVKTSEATYDNDWHLESHQSTKSTRLPNGDLSLLVGSGEGEPVSPKPYNREVVSIKASTEEGKIEGTWDRTTKAMPSRLHKNVQLFKPYVKEHDDFELKDIRNAAATLYSNQNKAIKKISDNK